MHQRTVFIIEDNKTEAMIMKLAISGFKNLSVEHFENGKDFLMQLDRRPYFIILDMTLPDMDGLEIIKKVKAWDPGIEIIVVSAQEDMALVAKSQDEGIFNYVTKSEGCLIYLKKTIENLMTVLASRTAAAKKMIPS